MSPETDLPPQSAITKEKTMGPTKEFRFGVMGSGATAESYASCAQTAERLGYSVFLSTDHLDLSGAHFSQLSPIPALAYAATQTRQIRLGVSVLNQDFRHPAVLAQEVASLDVLSDGRLELGLGAGWAEYEYQWAGIAFDSPRQRIDRFEEYITVVTSALQDTTVNVAGQYFQISDMPALPRPVQSPRPPVMIGGTGRRMLGIAARNADIVGINLGALSNPTAAAMDERIAWVRDAAGPRFEGLELNNIVGTLVVAEGDRREALRAELARQRADGREFINEGIDEDQILSSPTALVGSVDYLVDELLGWRERWGITYVILPHTMMEQFAPVVAALRGR